jgi:signal transduction histidine kinase
MLNLLSNAIKFSTDGDQIHVIVEAMKIKDKINVSIIVKDFGCGIKEEDKLTLF